MSPEQAVVGTETFAKAGKAPKQKVKNARTDQLGKLKRTPRRRSSDNFHPCNEIAKKFLAAARFRVIR